MGQLSGLLGRPAMVRLLLSKRGTPGRCTLELNVERPRGTWKLRQVQSILGQTTISSAQYGTFRQRASG
jgi:hypothetical protein